VVARDAVRGDVQAEFQPVGPVYQEQGRHQRVRCSLLSVLGAGCRESQPKHQSQVEVNMIWTTVPFGKHQGKTLPQIVIDDPDWFFWILPRLYGHLKIEADELGHKASRIKILQKSPRKWLVEFRFVHGKGFCGFDIVRADSFMDPKWSIRLPYLDFSLVRSHKAYDKKGYKNLIRDFRNLYFDGRNLTKKRCEVFFGNDDNFL
jgi:hypothetical protein